MGVREHRPARGRRVVVGVALALTTLVVMLIAFTTEGSSYTTFQRKCAALSGAKVIALRTTTRDVAMGAPVKDYEVGCRSSDGTILSTYTGEHPVLSP